MGAPPDLFWGTTSMSADAARIPGGSSVIRKVAADAIGLARCASGDFLSYPAFRRFFSSAKISI